MTEITRILQNWSSATDDARGVVISALYDDLRANARRHLRNEQRMNELQPTLLVHEAYLRLIKVSNLDLSGRSHFLGLAGKIMRQILVDEARRFSAGKRDRALQTQLTDDFADTGPATIDILELSELLDGLEKLDPLYVQIFDAKAFAGMTFEECAEALGISVSSVKRKWKISLAWLQEQMQEQKPPTDLDPT